MRFFLYRLMVYVGFAAIVFVVTTVFALASAMAARLVTHQSEVAITVGVVSGAVGFLAAGFALIDTKFERRGR